MLLTLNSLSGSVYFYLHLHYIICCQILEDPDAYSYVDGIAVHWYVDFVPENLLNITHHLYPDKFILGTEACEGKSIIKVCVRIMS